MGILEWISYVQPTQPVFKQLHKGPGRYSFHQDTENCIGVDGTNILEKFIDSSPL